MIARDAPFVDFVGSKRALSRIDALDFNFWNNHSSEFLRVGRQIGRV